MKRTFVFGSSWISILALGCMSLPGGSLFAPAPAWELPPPKPVDGRIVAPGALHRAELPNGMEILILEDDRLPRLSVGVEVLRGAGSEDLENAGVSSIASEVMQRGAGGRDGLALAKVVEDAGAALSVAAGWDTTGISLSGLSEDRALLMEILGDVALRPRFDGAEFRKAKAEHLAGIVAAQDDPGTLIRWHTLRVLFEGHRYGLPRSGTTSTVEAIELSDVRAYWENRFVPRDTIFWAVGQVDAKEMIAEVTTLFGNLEDLPGVKAVEPTPARAPEARRIVVVDKPELGQARIMLAHEGIARTEPDRMPISLMNDALGGSGFSSRLMKRVRSQEGLTYGIGSGFSMRRVPGPFSIATFTRVPEVGRVVNIILEEMEAIRATKPVDEVEFAKFISYSVGGFGLSLETSESVLSSLVDLEVHDLPSDSLDTYRGRMRDVTLEQVRSATRDYLHPERAAIVVLGPAEALVPQLEGLGEVEIWEP